MNELTLDGKIYVSSKRAAEITGYAKDYVGQLCREGHVEARLVGRNWYVLETSIREHRFGKKEEVVEASIETRKPTANVSAWEKTHYESEVPAYIPPIRHEDVWQNTVASPFHVRGKQAVIEDIQSALQDWSTAQEPVAGDFEATSPDQEVSRSDSTEVPVHIQPIAEEELSVQEERLTNDDTPPAQVAVTDESWQEVIDNLETEDTAQERPHKSYGRLFKARKAILRTIFIAVALSAMTLAVFGSGIVNKITGNKYYRFNELNVITGTTVYKR